MWLVHQFSVHYWSLVSVRSIQIMARAKSPRNGNARKAEVATMPVVTSPDVKQGSFSIDLETEISRRAYELYEQRGCTPGKENEEWLITEREVLYCYVPPQSDWFH